MYLTFILLAVTSALAQNTTVPPHGCIRENDVPKITLTRGRLNTPREGKDPIEQLQCLGSLCEYTPEQFLCRNDGFDGQYVNWECKVDELDTRVKIRNFEVSWDGCRNRDDPDFVIIGSAVVYFELVSTGSDDNNAAPSGDDGYYYGGGNNNEDNNRDTPSSNESPPDAGTLVIVVIIFVCITCSVAAACIYCGGSSGGYIGGGIPMSSGYGNGGSYASNYSPSYSSSSATGGSSNVTVINRGGGGGGFRSTSAPRPAYRVSAPTTRSVTVGSAGGRRR